MEGNVYFTMFLTKMMSAHIPANMIENILFGCVF